MRRLFRQIPCQPEKGAAARCFVKRGLPTKPMRHHLFDSSTTRLPTLGERLRAARYTRNLTQQDLADGTFSKSYISAIERGKMMPSIAALRLLATRLDTSLASLLGEPDLPQQGADAPAEDHLTQRLDKAEALLYQGDPASALELLGTQETGGELRQQNPARWKWLCAWALLQVQQEQEAIALLEQGLQEAEASQATCALGHFAFTLATAQAARQQDEAAEQYFQTALRCAADTDDQALLDSVQEQYAALLAAQGRYQHAYDLLYASMASVTRSATHHSAK